MCTRVVPKTELLVISDILHGLIVFIELIINFFVVGSACTLYSE